MKDATVWLIKPDSIRCALADGTPITVKRSGQLSRYGWQHAFRVGQGIQVHELADGWHLA